MTAPATPQFAVAHVPTSAATAAPAAVALNTRRGCSSAMADEPRTFDRLFHTGITASSRTTRASIVYRPAIAIFSTVGPKIAIAPL